MAQPQNCLNAVTEMDLPTSFSRSTGGAGLFHTGAQSGDTGASSPISSHLQNFDWSGYQTGLMGAQDPLLSLNGVSLLGSGSDYTELQSAALIGQDLYGRYDWKFSK